MTADQLNTISFETSCRFYRVPPCPLSRHCGGAVQTGPSDWPYTRLAGNACSPLHAEPAQSCEACTNPPVPTLHFLRSDSSDLVQFRDADGILRVYFFSANVLSSPGTYDTLPGINVAVGRLVVAAAETPEPSTIGLVMTGLGLVALRRLRRGRSV